MKEVPKQDHPDVAGGELYPKVPCFPDNWPPEIQDGPTFPEPPTAPCETPSTI
jgi:hypothetical protein